MFWKLPDSPFLFIQHCAFSFGRGATGAAGKAFSELKPRRLKVGPMQFVLHGDARGILPVLPSMSYPWGRRGYFSLFVGLLVQDIPQNGGPGGQEPPWSISFHETSQVKLM